MRKYLVYIAIALALLTCPLYFGLHLIGIEPLEPYICLSSTPSEAQITHTLRYGPQGLGEDGLTYKLIRHTCPDWNIVSTPRMVMDLQIKSGETILSEGQLNIGVVSEKHIEIFSYTPNEVIHPELQNRYPSLKKFMQVYVH